MSRVFLAEDAALGRRVVLKVLPPEMAAGVNIERFRREIQLAASLQHPHIVPLHTAGQASELFYYTMPLVEGESLRAKLAREGELPIPEAVRILRDVSDALAHAHAHGVVHRDIKPDNVLLSGHHAVVTDFGVAKAVSEAAGPSSLTSLGVALGTPAYMAPEQAAADPHVDHRADVYALGVLAYEMLTGRAPFTAPSPQMVLAAHVTQAPEPVTQHRASVPPALAALVMRCLEKKPADRWQSAAELHHQLESMATPSGGLTPTGTTPTTAVAGKRRRRLAPALATIAVLVLGVSAALVFWPQRASGRVDPNLAVIAPFRASGADASLAYLREGMLDLLAAKLTGVGGLRASDPRTVLSAWHRATGAADRDLSEDEAVRMAERIGAGHLLLGSVVGNAARIVLSASLLTVPSGRASAQASVEGPADSLPNLIDRLTAQLLAGQAGEAGSRLGALGSTPLPALRAYLAGQAAYRRGRYAEAARLFEDALEEDSTFALAGLGLAAVAIWVEPSEHAPALALAREVRERLSERDRALLDAYFVTIDRRDVAAADVLAAWGRAVAQAPDRPEAHYELGDVFYHNGDLLGIEDARGRAAAAFTRALELDSTFAAPLGHLVEIAVAAGDTASARRLGALFFAADSASDVAEFIRWRLAIGLGDTAALRAIRSGWDRRGTESLVRILGIMQVDGVGLEDAPGVAQALRSRASAPTGPLGGVWLLSAVALNRGRPTEALAVYRTGESVQPSPHELLRQRVYVALYWDGDSAAAAEAVRALAPDADAPPRRGAAEQADQSADACAVGEWRLRLGDVRGADRAIAQLRRAAATAGPSAPGAVRPYCADLLDAVLGTRQGRSNAQALVERLDSLARVWGWGAEVNLTIARLREEHGDLRGALGAVRRRAYHWGLGTLVLAPLLREEGRLAALTGDTAGAIRAFQHYLALRSDPEPAIAPEVARVRSELGTLERAASN